MKKLYQFTVDRVEKVEEKITSKNDKGEEIVELKLVEKKVPQKFFLRKATRLLFDEAELIYGIEYSKAVKDGLLTRAQLATKFADEAKTFSKSEQENYTKNYLLLFGKEQELIKLSVKKDEERTVEEKAAFEKLLGEMLQLRKELQEFEFEQASLYDHTAEVRARNKTILWWTCYLSHKEDETPLFGTGDFKERLKSYDDIEENDDFLLSVIKKILYLISFWYMGRAEKQEDFDKLIQSTDLQ